MAQIREPIEILERGNVYFFYRPAAGTETPQGLVDVQRFHIVLSPEGRDVLRVLTVGRKRLPEAAEGGQRRGGLVRRAGGGAEEVGGERGRREGAGVGPGFPSPARPAGEGVYGIV